jgi:hypothetical protein
VEEDDVTDCEVDYICHKSPVKATHILLEHLFGFYQSTVTTKTMKLAKQSDVHRLKKFPVEDTQSTPTIDDIDCH